VYSVQILISFSQTDNIKLLERAADYMPKFFTEKITDNVAVITGEDAEHIARVLRMRVGEPLTVCDLKGTDYESEITSVSLTEVILKITNSRPSVAEPTVRVTLFQGLPKADKMELIVQKCVELGVTAIVPVITTRCVSRPDEAALNRKVERWGKIAQEAAKQSGRGILPKVKAAISFEIAVEQLAKIKTSIMFYEKSTVSLKEILSVTLSEIGILIGPEGGFEKEEAEYAQRLGIQLSSLGPRILRTETAPICALSAIMFATGNL